MTRAPEVIVFALGTGLVIGEWFIPADESQTPAVDSTSASEPVQTSERLVSLSRFIL